jgi:hypothetical protein
MISSLPARPFEWNCSASWSVMICRFGRLLVLSFIGRASVRL